MITRSNPTTVRAMLTKAVRCSPAQRGQTSRAVITQFRRHLLQVALTCLPVIAFAQPHVVVQINIPAGPMAKSLGDLAMQSGTPILADTSLVANKQSKALNASVSPLDALRALLSGSGLHAEERDGALIVVPNATGAANVLDPVTVTGSQWSESATGPALGLTATRSATGSKTDTSLLENPQSVSVITRQEMDQRGVQSITEAVQYTPGVTVDQLGMDNQTEWISLRGFSSPSAYLDGLRLNSIWQSEPFGLERVEILRGPASVLYGESVPGGLTGLVSKRPSFEPSGQAQVQLGNQHRKQTAWDVTGPLDEEGQWAYRVIGLARDSKTSVDYVSNDRLYLAPSLTWQPSAATSLTLLGLYQRDKIGFLPQYLPAAGTLYSNPNGDVPRHRYVGEPDREKYLRTQSSAGYIFDHAFNDTIAVHQTARYARTSQAFNSVTGNGLLEDQRTLRRRLYDANQTAYDMSVDTHLIARLKTGEVDHTVLTGVEFARQRYDSTNWICGTTACAPTIDLFDPKYGQTITRPDEAATDALQHQERVGVYAQDQIKVGKLTVTAGGRWDVVRQSTLDRLSDSTARSRDHAFTARTGIAYSFENGITPYASYAESFQPTSGLIFPSTPAKPMTGRQYEIGVKYQSQGQDNFVGISLYDLRQQNMTTTDPNNPCYIVQSAQTKVQGAEIEAKLTVARQLDVIVSYTYTDAKYTRSNDGHEGNQVSGTPRSQAALWADYRFNGALAGLSAGVGVRYVGNKFGNSSNSIELPSYTLVDAALRYDLGALGDAWRNASLAVNVNNLFDRDYVAICTSANRCYFGAPRAAMATLTYRW